MNRQLQKVQTLPSLIIAEHEQQPSAEELQAAIDAAYAALESVKDTPVISSIAAIAAHTSQL